MVEICGHFADALLNCGDKCFCRSCWQEHIRECEECKAAYDFAEMFQGGFDEMLKKTQNLEKSKPAES